MSGEQRTNEVVTTVDSIATSIAQASQTEGADAERHCDFGQNVTRFQDMAFGCAYGRLGDHTLAEDAAQESFLVAWKELGSLREPEAFPGWFKRIVLSQCHRATRGKR